MYKNSSYVVIAVVSNLMKRMTSCENFSSKTRCVEWNGFSCNFVLFCPSKSITPRGSRRENYFGQKPKSSNKNYGKRVKYS